MTEGVGSALNLRLPHCRGTGWFYLGGQPAAVFAGTDSNCLCRQALGGQLRRLIGSSLPGSPLVLHCEGLGLVSGSYKKIHALAAFASRELLRGDESHGTEKESETYPSANFLLLSWTLRLVTF